MPNKYESQRYICSTITTKNSKKNGEKRNEDAFIKRRLINFFFYIDSILNLLIVVVNVSRSSLDILTTTIAIDLVKKHTYMITATTATKLFDLNRKKQRNERHLDEF